MLDVHLSSLTLMLAQDAQPAPPLPGAGDTTALPPASTSGTVAPGGAAPTGGGTTGGAPPGLNTMLLIVVLVVVMLAFSLLGSRRERKRREALISAVKKHDRVQTIGGVIGSVVEVKPDYIVLKVDESSNTRITFARSAVQQVLSSSPDSGSAKPEQAE